MPVTNIDGGIQIFDQRDHTAAIINSHHGGAMSIFNFDDFDVFIFDQGTMIIRDPVGRDVFRFNSSTAELVLAGDIKLRNAEVRGDIKLINADCAEEFDVSESSDTEAGNVMVLGNDGKLTQSNVAYDKKVAGVISGGGSYKSGIVLDRNTSKNMRVPLALMGKVYCKVDAQYSEINVGDLLTTSESPGYAMKALDPLKAFGATVGKALSPISKGKGLVPILVGLQ
jgi:hypothetical protein